MSVSQAEFVAYKGETADRLKRLEDTMSQTMADMKKAAPWSVTIETAVAAAEAKVEAAHNQVFSLFDATKAKTETLRRRAAEVAINPRNGKCLDQKTWSCCPSV